MTVKCINGSVNEFRPLQIVFQPAYEIQMTPFLNTSIISSLTRDSIIFEENIQVRISFQPFYIQELALEV